MIVDAAVADALEGKLDEREIALLAGALAGAPQELEQRGLRKFRRALQPAVHRIDRVADVSRQLVELGAADHDPAGRPRALAQPRHQRGAIVCDAVGLLFEQPGHFVQHVDETRPAVARGFRKIGAAPERLALGREKHGQRPSALLAEHVQGRHVDLIDVRALLAVDLDADKTFIQELRGLLVFKRFPLHHVAPVAGRVTDTEKNGFVLGAGFLERIIAPGIPVHGIVLML